MGIHEQIAANKRRSFFLVFGLLIVLLLMGASVGILTAGSSDGALLGVVVAFAIWAVQMIMYNLAAEQILMSGLGGRQLAQEDSPRLFNIVEEMKIASGLGYMPKIYMIDDPSPNAFAIGRRPENSSIGVTTGLLQRLNRDELQAVIAHEMGHLNNGDSRFITLAGVMLGTIVILSDMVGRSFRFGFGRVRSRSSSRDGGGAQAVLILVALAVAILGPIVAQILYFACSRRREFLADACSALYTRYPEGLASALEKISRAAGNMEVNRAIAPMFIVNPMYAVDSEPFSLMSTHPRTADRIKVLREMGGASLADYDEAYKRATGKNGVLGSAARDAAPVSVRQPSGEGPIEARQDVANTMSRLGGYIPVQCQCGVTMKVPELFENDTVNCIRCGTPLPLPAARERFQHAVRDVQPAQQAVDMTPLAFTRAATGGWQTFRCSCGGAVQLSPKFSAPMTSCPRCGRKIMIDQKAA